MLLINGIASDRNRQRKQQTSFFSRIELTLILNVYSKRVSAGEWRDYALDHTYSSAIFSIFKSSHELPLYTIEKKRLKGNNLWLYIVSDRRKALRQAARLKDVLEYLENLPRLVNN